MCVVCVGQFGKRTLFKKRCSDVHEWRRILRRVDSKSSGSAIKGRVMVGEMVQNENGRHKGRWSSKMGSTILRFEKSVVLGVGQIMVQTFTVRK